MSIKKAFICFCLALPLFFSSLAISEQTNVVRQTITISFSFGERTGQYTGGLADGLPDGFGIFETQNSEGDFWMYVGNFVNGHMDGEGRTFWEDGQSRFGSYRNDEFASGTVIAPYGYWETIGVFEEGLFTGTENLYSNEGLLVSTCDYVKGEEADVEGPLLTEELLATKEKNAATPSPNSVAGIFPCESVAKFVRDESGLISINDEITQEQLGKITTFGQFSGYGDVNDITGIMELRNLFQLRLESYWQEDVKVSELPENIGELKELSMISLHYQLIEKIPDSICDLPKLTSLSITGCPITELPEGIGNLTTLTWLNLSGSAVEKLPDSIGNLVNLEYLDISDTNITELPESIKNLTNLETFRRSGLDLD